MSANGIAPVSKEENREALTETEAVVFWSMVNLKRRFLIRAVVTVMPVMAVCPALISTVTGILDTSRVNVCVCDSGS